MADCAMKYGWWLPFLAVSVVMFGCAGGSQQQKSPWPWDYNRQDGRYPSGDHVAVSGPVASFGDAPKAVKPVPPESLEAPGSGAAAAKPSPPSPSPGKAPDPNAAGNRVKKGYDFSVNEKRITTPSYLPVGSVRDAYDIFASNHGDAPVSVTIGSDQTSRNMTTDKPLPVIAVIPPHTDQVLVHVSARLKNEAYRFGYTCLWSIGDHTARHQCPERYRFPFSDKVRAFAGVSDPAGSTPYTRYAVAFSLPAGTPVLAARKGTVVQIGKNDDKIDILHDDGTIASYSHLGRIGEGVTAGKSVAAGDAIGMPGAADNPSEAYLQLAVWHPEPRLNAALTANGQNPGYDLVSFPLEFCAADSDGCRVLTRSQWLSGDRTAEAKKQNKRGTQPAVRKSEGN
ncbi:M23 family metallopeptidase [Geobacter sp. FeAm09]|uniref:M23 family metallopeptidase n=1 Tax=Geobacter sp. FeAm09 TaxID=2597769 RepID=UPI00143CC2B5|nr:M23 family metallopeptidase [Geobacter sp. FeAm09]